MLRGCTRTVTGRAPPAQGSGRAPASSSYDTSASPRTSTLQPARVASSTSSTSSTSRNLDDQSVEPADFALLVNRPATFVLNVHTPDEGTIPGTDAAIPYDQLQRRSGELPDRSTALAVYCRTGRMSTEAVPTLRELGFTRITELSGGMEAWQADGRPLLTQR